MGLGYLVVAGALTLALVPHVPAQAAMPTSKPTETKACPNNPKKKLRIWVTEKVFAVDNPCSYWFAISTRAPSPAIAPPRA